jgi:hypothetical protein
MQCGLQAAILCYTDLIRVFQNKMLPHVDGAAPASKPSDSALCQLLLKSVSKDKKFVLEAAQCALMVAAETLEPEAMARKLMVYCKHRFALIVILSRP